MRPVGHLFKDAGLSQHNLTEPYLTEILSLTKRSIIFSVTQVSSRSIAERQEDSLPLRPQLQPPLEHGPDSHHLHGQLARLSHQEDGGIHRE